ncbi:MAG: dihydrodipicolinate synthase family protein, partial [Verrucomicrobiota bacterium]
METTEAVEAPKKWRKRLAEGIVIPALPLALNEDGSWSEQHQRALVRYYIEAGAGGVAVGVHSTQFAIREPRHGLFEQVLRLAVQSMDQFGDSGLVKVAGVCGLTEQARAEAELAGGMGYHAGLLGLGAFRDAAEKTMLDHARAVAEVLPVIGFYLQSAVGGQKLSYRFWREFCELENVVAIKVAPFNRYQTLDVVRAVIDSGREDV